MDDVAKYIQDVVAEVYQAELSAPGETTSDGFVRVVPVDDLPAILAQHCADVLREAADGCFANDAMEFWQNLLDRADEAVADGR